MRRSKFYLPDNIDNSSFHGAALKPCGCLSCNCDAVVGGVTEQVKDNAWMIAGGAAVIFLSVALLRMRK